jgi:uncharacterized protein
VRNPEIWIRIYQATLDTNLFLRTLIRLDNLPNRILDLWEAERFILVLSPEIFDELQKVLSRPTLMAQFQYRQADVSELIESIKELALFVEPRFSYHLCRDPEDDRFIDCAIWGRVDFLVSYDNDLLDDATLKQALFEFGVEIVSGPIFFQKLQEAEITVG